MDAGQSVEYVDADHFEALGALLHSAERRLENKSALSTATAAVGGKRQAALSPGTLKVQEQQHPQQQAGQCRALFHSSTGSNGWADAAAGQHAALQQNSTVSGASRPDLQPQLHVQPQHPPQQQHQNHQQHHILTEPTAQQQELPARNTHKLTPASAGAAGVQAGGCGSVAHQLPADQQHAGVQFQQAHGAVQQQQGQHTGWQQPAAGHAHAAEQLRPAQSQQQQQHEQLDLQHNRTKSHGGQPLMQPPAGPQVQVQQQSHPGQQRQVQHWQQQAGLQAQRQQQQQPLPPPPPQQAGHSGQVQQWQWQQQQRQHQQQVHLHAPVQAPSFTVSGALLPVISAAAPCTGSSGGSAQQQQQQQHTNHHPTCGAAAGAACGSKAGSSGVCSGGGKCRTPFGPSAGSGGQKLVRHTAGSSGGASCTAGAHKQVVAGGSSCNRNAGSVAAHAVAQCAGNGGVGATGCAAAGTDTAVMAAAASPAAVADYEACVGSNSSRVDASYVSNSTDAQRVGWAACQQLGDLQGGMNHSSRSMRVSFSGGSSRSRGGSAAGSGGEQSDLKRSNSWSAGQWQQQPLLQQQQHRSSQQQQQQQWPRQQQQHRVIQGHPHGSCHQGSRPQQQQQPISQQQEGVQPPSRPPGQQQQQHDWQQWQVHLQNTVPPQEAPAAHLQQVQLPPQQQPGGSCQQSSKASAAAALAATARHYPPLPAAVTAAPGSQPLPAAVAAGAQLLPPPAPAEAATAAGPHLPPPPAAAAAAAGAAGCGAGTAAVRRKLPSSLAAQRGRGPGSGGGGNGSSSMPGSCAGGGSGGSGGGYSGGYSGGGGSGGGRCVQQQQWGAGQQQLGAVVRGPKQLPWAGRVRYACTAADVDAACRHMLAAGPTVIGFDVEWKPSFVKGAPPNKAALVQLAYACRGGHDCRTKVEDQGRGVVVLLLHIAHSGITQKLQEVLLDDQIVKLGVNINGDIIKLAADYGTKVFGASDLSDTAHGHQLRAVAGVTANVQPKKWSLAGLIEEVFNLELPKPQHIRMGDWERRPLTAEQQRYAAMDAYACLLLHWELQQLPTKQTLSQQLIEKMRERAGVDEDED